MKPVLPMDHKVGTLPGSYRDLAEDFIDFATKKNCPIHGRSPKYPVYYLGTYWDNPPRPTKSSIKLEEKIRHLFVNPIITIVSVEEHQNEFGPSPRKNR